MRNIEIKARIKDHEAFKSKARQLSGNNGTILEQTDTFFKVQEGRLKLRRFKNADGELIFYQRPDVHGPKLSTYKKTLVNESNCQGLCEVLENSNGILGIVSKTRYLYLVGQSRVHIDNVQSLGLFAEIEVVLTDAQTIEDGEKIMSDLMEKLGIKTDDLIATAYLDMILADNKECEKICKHLSIDDSGSHF